MLGDDSKLRQGHRQPVNLRPPALESEARLKVCRPLNQEPVSRTPKIVFPVLLPGGKWEHAS